MNLFWISDPHFEFVVDQTAREFVENVTAQSPDAVVITGDISNSYHLEKHLALLARLPCDVYFVLGNHDFYESNFAAVQDVVTGVCLQYSNLHQLGQGEIVRLTETTNLVGHGGWADGRAGNGSRSNARLNDHLLIQNLVRRDPGELFAILNALGDQSAEYISTVGETAWESCDKLIVATHVPPFIEASLYRGRPSDPEYAPHFVNVAMGKSLIALATRYQQKSLMILCGHTHHAAQYTPRSNLITRVSGNEYKEPRVTEVIKL